MPLKRKKNEIIGLYAFVLDFGSLITSSWHAPPAPIEPLELLCRTQESRDLMNRGRIKNLFLSCPFFVFLHIIISKTYIFIIL